MATDTSYTAKARKRFTEWVKSGYENDEAEMPIWEQLAAIGESAPEGTWDAVPTDLSMKIDDLVYRHRYNQ